MRAAESLFDQRIARSHLERIRSNSQPGLTPLGAELELSNLGYRAVTSQNYPETGFDKVYDGFKYFHDFRLDTISWKLGAYIDDHSGTTDRSRRPGFLELAPGRLNITSELSRPATADPWLMSNLIREIVNFYDVRPHSLHLSFQLRERQIGKQKILPLDYVKCLLVLGGGPKRKKTGKLWISRMGFDEITQYQYGEELVFARTSKRKWYLGEDEIADKPPAQATTSIQQYKFIRLQRRTNYEPLIMGLKGLQLAYNPADYLSADQLRDSSQLRSEYEELKKWSDQPTEIDRNTIKQFVKLIEEGLMTERHHKPAHKPHYINWALKTLEAQLRIFNKKIIKTPHHA